MAMVQAHLGLFDDIVSLEKKVQKGTPVELLPLEDYDHILISLSGGKDSMACLFHLLNLGVDPAKMELVHQCVDGGPQDDPWFDWPCAESYVRAVSQYFGIQTSFQWRAGGIHGELMRENALTGDVFYETHDGKVIHLPTTKGTPSTRHKFPAMSPNLNVRWCSAVVKIDVFRRYVNNNPKFQGTIEEPKKILVISGERRQESANRARYLEKELHPCNTKSRIVHWWRPVIDWKEEQIWQEYEKRRFLPMLPYLLGWSRTSCFTCIFQTADLWAMVREIAPERFNKLVEKEKELGHTIDPKFSLTEKANRGSLDRLPKDHRVNKWVEMALSRNITVDDLIMDKWELPAGALRYSSVCEGPM